MLFSYPFNKVPLNLFYYTLYTQLPALLSTVAIYILQAMGHEGWSCLDYDLDVLWTSWFQDLNVLWTQFRCRLHRPRPGISLIVYGLSRKINKLFNFYNLIRVIYICLDYELNTSQFQDLNVLWTSRFQDLNVLWTQFRCRLHRPRPGISLIVYGLSRKINKLFNFYNLIRVIYILINFFQYWT